MIAIETSALLGKRKRERKRECESEIRIERVREKGGVLRYEQKTFQLTEKIRI